MTKDCCKHHDERKTLFVRISITIIAFICGPPDPHCCKHPCERKSLFVRISIAIIVFTVAFGFVVFLVWVVLQPKKPSLILQDATIYAFNLSADSSFLTSNMQITISSKNPNERIGILYEKLDAYASYRNQQITLATELPRSYQGHKDIAVWSPFLCGNSVPVSPYFEAALAQDLNAGMVLMNIKVDGKVKWKVGTWISWKYQINVNCPAYISFGDQCKGVQVGPAIKYQLVQGCSVDVSAS